MNNNKINEIIMNDKESEDDDTTMATQTTTTKILTIGDPQERITPKKDKIKNDFNVACTNYLSLVLLGNPKPVDDVKGLCPIEWFGMVTFAFENQPTRYQFYCYPPRKRKPTHVYLNYFYQTINAQAVLRDVRRFLRHENWKSKDCIIGPLKGDICPTAYQPEEYYILGFIFEAINMQRAKAFPYLMQLHRERVRNNLNNNNNNIEI